jgi:hypothetical protein
MSPRPVRIGASCCAPCHRGHRAAATVARTVGARRSHRPRTPVLHGLRSPDSRREVSVHALAARAPTPRHPLSQAVHGETHVGELEPDDWAQSAVGGERAWPPAHYNAIRVRGLDGRSGGSGHFSHSPRDDPHGRNSAHDGSRSTRDRNAVTNASCPARCASVQPVAHTSRRGRARMG